MWFLARMYNAQQAMDMGLINAVVPLDNLEEETLAWCAAWELSVQIGMGLTGDTAFSSGAERSSRTVPQP